MIKRERASAVVVSGGKILVVRLQDPHSNITEHFVPGGKVEIGETAEAAAIRETLEESGVRIKIFNKKPLVVTYPFCWNSTVYDCTTSFFAASCDDMTIPENLDDAPYNKGALWVDINEIEKIFGFDQNILKAIASVLESNFS